MRQGGGRDVQEASGPKVQPEVVLEILVCLLEKESVCVRGEEGTGERGKEGGRKKYLEKEKKGGEK